MIVHIELTLYEGKPDCKKTFVQYGKRPDHTQKECLFR